MVSEKEVLEMFNKFPEVPERFKEHLKSQIKWYTLNGERITYRTWLETIKIECGFSYLKFSLFLILIFFIF